jgi:hypothetical protein
MIRATCSRRQAEPRRVRSDWRFKAAAIPRIVWPLWCKWRISVSTPCSPGSGSNVLAVGAETEPEPDIPHPLPATALVPQPVPRAFPNRLPLPLRDRRPEPGNSPWHRTAKNKPRPNPSPRRSAKSHQTRPRCATEAPCCGLETQVGNEGQRGPAARPKPKGRETCQGRQRAGRQQDRQGSDTAEAVRRRHPEGTLKSSVRLVRNPSPSIARLVARFASKQIDEIENGTGRTCNDQGFSVEKDAVATAAGREGIQPLSEITRKRADLLLQSGRERAVLLKLLL